MSEFPAGESVNFWNALGIWPQSTSLCVVSATLLASGCHQRSHVPNIPPHLLPLLTASSFRRLPTPAGLWKGCQSHQPPYPLGAQLPRPAS